MSSVAYLSGCHWVGISSKTIPGNCGVLLNNAHLLRCITVVTIADKYAAKRVEISALAKVVIRY